MNNTDKYTICMPVYNEGEYILQYMESLANAFAKAGQTLNFSICDDSGTREYEKRIVKKCEDLSIPLTYHGWNRNRGAAASIYKAGRMVKDGILIFADADGQFTPEDILFGVEKYRTSQKINAVIYERVEKIDSTIKVLGSKISGYISLLYLGKKLYIHDPNCALKIISVDVFRRMPLAARHLNYSFEMLFYLSYLNINIEVLNCASRERTSGASSVKIFKDAAARLLFLLHITIVTLMIKMKILSLEENE